MKKVQMSLIIAVIASVFLLSFLIGRATALREKDKGVERTQIYSGTIPIPEKNEDTVNASAKAKKVEDSQKKKEVKLHENTLSKVPERMLFPCGNTVLKEYSQSAVFSETMGDWRAHTGIDYAAEKDTPVVCSWDGTVSRVYKDKLWGNCIEIEHDGNLKSIYKNLAKKTYVKKGQKINKGQVIGKVGNSAAVESRETSHLHFELWQADLPINPKSYVY